MAGMSVIEMMIVCAIIALVASIAIPFFVRYRANAQAKACVSNLRQISAAKELWAIETRQPVGAPCPVSEVMGAGKYIRNQVRCPAAGAVDYDVGNVGDYPKCPVEATFPAHAL